MSKAFEPGDWVEHEVHGFGHVAVTACSGELAWVEVYFLSPDAHEEPATFMNVMPGNLKPYESPIEDVEITACQAAFLDYGDEDIARVAKAICDRYILIPKRKEKS